LCAPDQSGSGLGLTALQARSNNRSKSSSRLTGGALHCVYCCSISDACLSNKQNALAHHPHAASCCKTGIHGCSLPSVQPPHFHNPATWPVTAAAAALTCPCRCHRQLPLRCVLPLHLHRLLQA
jgi:hypothetical protein